MLREINDIFVIVYENKKTEIFYIDASTREGFCQSMDIMSYVKKNKEKDKIIEFRTFRGHEVEVRLENESPNWRERRPSYNDIPIFRK